MDAYIVSPDTIEFLSRMDGKDAAKAKIHYVSFPAASPQQVGASKSPLCLLCRVISQIPLQLVGRIANKSATNP